jgi:hypothetical protein
LSCPPGFPPASQYKGYLTPARSAFVEHANGAKSSRCGCYYTYVCSRLAVILHFLSAPSRLSFSRCVHRRVCHRLSTRVLRRASVYPRHNNCLLPLQHHHRTVPYLAYCSTLSPDLLPPTTLGKLAAHGRLSIPGMNSTNTIRILIRPVTLLDC